MGKRGRQKKRQTRERSLTDIFAELDLSGGAVTTTHKRGRKGKGDMHGNYSDGDWRRPGYGGIGPSPGGGAKPAPSKEVDPDVARALTDYRTYEGPDSLEGLMKPRTWFMAGNGLVPVLKTPLGVFIGKAQGPTLAGLPTLDKGVVLNCPKLPWSSLSEVVAFFRAIHKEIKAEAMVQFFWNPESGEYVAHVPLQLVSGGGVHHQSHFDAEGKLWHILDIHSHHTMAPFWSGTDDADEERFEGRLFGVIGNIDKAIPGMSWRHRAMGAFTDLLVEDCVDLTPVQDVKIERVFHAGDLMRISKGGTKFEFEFDPFEKATYPDEWRRAVLDYDQLSKKDLPRVVRFGQKVLTDKEIGEMRANGYELDPVTNVWRLAQYPSSQALSRTSHQAGGDVSKTGGTPGGGNGSGYITGRKLYVLHTPTGNLYFQDNAGLLYPSYQKVGNGGVEAKYVDFVMDIDFTKVRNHMYPGGHIS